MDAAWSARWCVCLLSSWIVSVLAPGWTPLCSAHVSALSHAHLCRRDVASTVLSFKYRATGTCLVQSPARYREALCVAPAGRSSAERRMHPTCIPLNCALAFDLCPDAACRSHGNRAGAATPQMLRIWVCPHIPYQRYASCDLARTYCRWQAQHARTRAVCATL
jgi:hypothetical protein